MFIYYGQILKGSNKCGRIEHIQVAGQVGADMDRVDELAKVLPLEYVELDPGKLQTKVLFLISGMTFVFFPYNTFFPIHSSN